MQDWITPIILSGRHVRLEPLEERHAPGLLAAGADPRIWTLLVAPQIKSLDDAKAYVAAMKRGLEMKTSVGFATVLVSTGEVVGTTTFMDIQPASRSVEIGGTWINPAHWRTRANTEAKFLMLWHAFEELKANRVCLKTDLRNVQSQKAIERIGAKKEGVLRRHMVAADGHLRDSVYYSIIPEEWPGVRERLEAALR